MSPQSAVAAVVCLSRRAVSYPFLWVRRHAVYLLHQSSRLFGMFYYSMPYEAMLSGEVFCFQLALSAASVGTTVFGVWLVMCLHLLVKQALWSGISPV